MTAKSVEAAEVDDVHHAEKDDKDSENADGHHGSNS
jgi:hypothetical protein